MIEKIKEILNLGIEIRSNNFILNKTNWGDQITKFEYALHHPTVKAEYFYSDDDSYKDAIEIILEDLKNI